MAGVDLEIDGIFDIGVLLHSLHHAPHRRGHELIRIERNGGTIDEPLAETHFIYAIPERYLDPLAKILRIGLRKSVFAGPGGPELDIGIIRGDEGLALELPEACHDEFVNGL